MMETDDKAIDCMCGVSPTMIAESSECFFVECLDCSARTPEFADLKDAISAWNRMQTTAKELEN